MARASPGGDSLTSLPSLLGALMAILESYPLCARVTVVETKAFSLDQFFFKVRADLPEGHTLQARLYANRGYLN